MYSSVIGLQLDFTAWAIYLTFCMISSFSSFLTVMVIYTMYYYFNWVNFNFKIFHTACHTMLLSTYFINIFALEILIKRNQNTEWKPNTDSRISKYYLTHTIIIHVNYLFLLLSLHLYLKNESY